MEKILQDTNLEILVKVAKRASLLRKFQEETLLERNKAFDTYVKNQLTAQGISEDVLHDQHSREVLFNSLGKGFVFNPDQKVKNKLQAIEDEAYTLLPKDIQTEMWSPDTCGCKLHRVCKMVGEEYVCQTFETMLCEAHEGLTYEDVHDAVKVENTSKNLIEGELLKDESLSDEIPDEESGVTSESLGAGKSRPRKWKKGIKYEWSFSGKGKNRVLNVEVKGANLTKQKKDAVKSFSDTKFEEGKVNI